ncbi:MAG: 50S ribosomal protein L9 [Candidatus Rifleibacteriota bacterium]
MEVLMINNVPRVGRKGQIINVAEGYARNYLFPRNYAIPATDGAKKHLNLMKASWQNQEMRERKAYEEMAGKLDGMILKITKKAGEKGRLFGSVTSHELSEQIKAQVGLDIDKKLVVADHIKEVGEHPITIRFTGDIKAHLKVVVIPEEAEP